MSQTGATEDNPLDSAVYPKSKGVVGSGIPMQRMKKLEGTPAAIRPCDAEDFEALMRRLAKVADENGMAIVSCAEEIDLRSFGILPGKCVDDQVIAEAFGIEVAKTKDPAQRDACGCVVSRDIGMYESCLFGCRYCYATKSFDQAKTNFDSHDPNSPSLLGWHEPPEP